MAAGQVLLSHTLLEITENPSKTLHALEMQHFTCKIEIHILFNFLETNWMKTIFFCNNNE